MQGMHEVDQISATTTFPLCDCKNASISFQLMSCASITGCAETVELSAWLSDADSVDEFVVTDELESSLD